MSLIPYLWGFDTVQTGYLVVNYACEVWYDSLRYRSFATYTKPLSAYWIVDEI